ncbi:MAG TPA: FAD-dependent monooxygenase [Polyangia bacterium]|jgi:2-polyprenyl-6-methoxyphenol hydroxylase-like FAD-dependent oxidoreductase
MQTQFLDHAMPSDPCQVLIAGAGPTGLALALWLARAGVRVRIVERESSPPQTSRAIAVQARTLELYRQLGIADPIIAAGRTLDALNVWVRGHKVAHVPFGDIGRGRSGYPFVLMLAQDQHERLLTAAVEEAGISVQRGVSLTGFSFDDDGVQARLATPDGGSEVCAARYLAGCDGARSIVRHALKIGFPGGTYGHLFYVADLQAAGPGADGQLHIALDDAGFLGAFPLKGTGHVRLIGTVRADAVAAEPSAAGAEGSTLTWDDVDQRLLESVGLRVREMQWFSTYHVHHRVVEHFGQGPVFLLGDAAHIHSPVGGQGMNTGIGDAFNLAWKLAEVLRGRAPASLLDTYEQERRAFARRLVATTDRLFTLATRDGAIARWVRTHAVPPTIARVFSTDRGRQFLFATVSQTRIRYRPSALSHGHAGALHAGDRLPWLDGAADADKNDNYASLGARRWQAHVYGQPKPGIEAVEAACRRRDIPLLKRAWQPSAAEAGFEPGALYLIRPDGYLGFVDPDGGVADALEAYLGRHFFN